MEDNIRYKSEIVEKILKEASPVMKKKVSAKLKIAYKIDEERKRRNWSKLQLANRFNKNPSEITKWLSGTHNFTIDTLIEIEESLKINLISRGDIFEISGSRNIITPVHSDYSKALMHNILLRDALAIGTEIKSSSTSPFFQFKV